MPILHAQRIFWKKRIESIFLCVWGGGVSDHSRGGKVCVLYFCQWFAFPAHGSTSSSLKARIHLNLLLWNDCKTTGSCTDSLGSLDFMREDCYTHLHAVVTACYTKPAKRCRCAVCMAGGHLVTPVDSRGHRHSPTAELPHQFQGSRGWLLHDHFLPFPYPN